jgi:hypothetical protein
MYVSSEVLHGLLLKLFAFPKYSFFRLTLELCFETDARDELGIFKFIDVVKLRNLFFS